MGKNKYIYFLVVLGISLWVIIPGLVFAQVSAPGANGKMSTVYSQYFKITGKQDTIYIFNATGNKINSTYGSLIARLPNSKFWNTDSIIADSTKGIGRRWKTTDIFADSVNIKWRKYNHVVISSKKNGYFNDTINHKLFQTSSADSLIIDSLTNEDNTGYATCYRAYFYKKIKNLSQKDSVIKNDSVSAWIFINKVNLEISNRDGSYNYQEDFPCELSIWFKQEVKKQFSHWDLKNHASCTINKPDSFTWTTYSIKKGESNYTPDPKANLPVEYQSNKWVVNKPPTKYASYKYSVTLNTFNTKLYDSLYYTPRSTRAIFEVILPDSAAKDSLIGEAPLKFDIKNHSENGLRYTWTLMDSSIVKNDSVTITTTDTLEYIDSFYRVFYRPRTYTLKMVSENDWGCSDTTTQKVIVKESVFLIDEFPNVFTPDGLSHENRYPQGKPNDDLKNFFLPVKNDNITSIKRFRMKIVNRWGREMYDEVSQNLSTNWRGWDGMDGNSLATPGCYWYIYEVDGWGKIKTKKSQSELEKSFSVKGSGFFYLFHK